MYKGDKLTKEKLIQLIAFARENPDYTNNQLIKNFDISFRDADKLRYVLGHREILQEVLVRFPKYRVFLGGDFHCGHYAGLTPKGYQLQEDHPAYGQFAKFEKETWDFFEATITYLKPFTHAVFNGDLIEGKGEKSKSSELLVTDRNIQVDMAVKVIETVNAGKNVVSYGTPYHVGDGEQYERQVADRTDALVGSEHLLSIGGIIFNCKHHVGSSSTPYGSATPLLRDALWTNLWAQLEENPAANIVVRSHTHSFMKINDGIRTAIVLPALQGAMTKFGTLRMAKIVHWGFAYVDIYENGKYEVHEILYNPEAQKRNIVTL